MRIFARSWQLGEWSVRGAPIVSSVVNNLAWTPVWLWQILTSRQAIVANNGVAERSPDGRYSPQHYHKWPHHTEQHKLNCLMFTASREISEHLSLWPVTLTRRKLRNMSSPCRTEPGQGIIININILSGRAWQVAWADSNMWADTLDKNWSRVAVITRTVSPLHTHLVPCSCQYTQTLLGTTQIFPDTPTRVSASLL